MTRITTAAFTRPKTRPITHRETCGWVVHDLGLWAYSQMMLNDPSPWIRTAVAARMLTIAARQERVRSALRTAAAADEMALVRYATRYALRADLGGTAGPPVP
jgi:hypothetical protein